MTGAPELRTMEIIEEVEQTARGAYSGAFGWISGDGRADLGVVIRSLAGSHEGGWRIGTGGAITVASEMAEEHAESRWKAERLLAVRPGHFPLSTIALAQSGHHRHESTHLDIGTGWRRERECS